MPNRIGATVKISSEIAHLADNVQKKLVGKIIPRAIGKAVPIVRDALIARLPDGDTGKQTRRKQSAKSRARFPYKMKRRVRVKSLNNQRLAMKIVGVDSKGSHVNFDHGEKAKTVGRVHKLWWIDGVREEYATPALRKQHRDIPKLVQTQTADAVLSIVEDEVARAVKAGEAL